MSFSQENSSEKFVWCAQQSEIVTHNFLASLFVFPTFSQLSHSIATVSVWLAVWLRHSMWLARRLFSLDPRSILELQRTQEDLKALSKNFQPGLQTLAFHRWNRHLSGSRWVPSICFNSIKPLDLPFFGSFLVCAKKLKCFRLSGKLRLVSACRGFEVQKSNKRIKIRTSSKILASKFEPSF